MDQMYGKPSRADGWATTAIILFVVCLCAIAIGITLMALDILSWSWLCFIIAIVTFTGSRWYWRKALRATDEDQEITPGPRLRQLRRETKTHRRISG